MCAKKKYKKVDPVRLMHILGGRRMQSEAIKTANEVGSIMKDVKQRNAFINFGLPEIKDMDGPAEC